MKNVNENNLKTCIFLKADEFMNICEELEIRFDIELIRRLYYRYHTNEF